MNLSTQRNSSIELLRIICIVMIIVLHSIGFNQCCPGVSGSILGALGNCSVTTFILISGYFGVTNNPKKIFRLRNIASFYILGAIFLKYLMGDGITPNAVFSGIFPAISGKYWFLTSYIVLLILSPYINQLITSLENETFSILVVIILFILYLIPTFLKHDLVHDGGKGILQMIGIYIIGRYISVHHLGEKAKTKWLLLSLACIIFCIVGLNRLQQIAGLSAYFNARGLNYNFDADNSIFILMASFCIFSLFIRKSFSNKTINKIAGSVFAVYIMEWYARPLLLQYVDIPALSSAIQPIAIIGFAIVIFLICAAIDQLRMYATFRLERGFESFEYASFEKAKESFNRILKHCP